MAGIKITLGTLETKAVIKLLQLARDKDSRVTSKFFDDMESYELNRQIEPLYYRFVRLFEEANTN